jgi:exopolyphosphatase / guanosine-5'-triphosphate,3'-diphosphate pyrophosphatase
MTPAEATGVSATTGFRHFHDQLATLKQRLLAMSERAESLIDLSVESLLSRDEGKAEAVIAGDREVDLLELEIEERAVGLLALQQPMARDLRFIISAIKISSDLERVGDHAVNIAQSALRLIRMRSAITPDPEIEDMARRSRKMLGDAIDAFIRADGVLGREVCKSDDQVDALHDSVFRILLTHMMADTHTINPSLELFLVSRNLERGRTWPRTSARTPSSSPRGSRSSTTTSSSTSPGWHAGTSRPAYPMAAPRSTRPATAAAGTEGGENGNGHRDGPRDERTVRIAAIDIGSNSIRQIVADVSPGGAIRVVDEMKASPRLGTGLEETQELGDTAMHAAIDALGRMATLARQIGAERCEAVATSAVRDAVNGEEFLRRVQEETGLHVRLLDGQEEAYLSFRSALQHFELGVGRAVVMDIGGGSLELALSADGLLEHLHSLPFGAVRLTERHLRTGTRRRNVMELRRVVREGIRAPLPVRDWRGAQLIGSGGTFTNLAGIYLARQRVQTARTVHGTRVPRVEVEYILDVLQNMTPAERLTVPGLNPARADIIVAGLAVAAEVMARLEAKELLVSAYGIREGLLLETAAVAPTIADPGEARERSVRAFAERSHYEEPHARQVQRLALQLFDALGPRLGCEPADRQALSDAALLHDVGYHINYNNHHKHSYHLILHADFLGMSPEEQVVIANVARYHRGTMPQKKHPNFGVLDKETRRRIRRLAALLRVADGLDRGHARAVERVRVRSTTRALRLMATPVPQAPTLRLELWGASRKSDLLARLLGVPVEVQGPDGRVVSNDETTDGERVD